VFGAWIATCTTRCRSRKGRNKVLQRDAMADAEARICDVESTEGLGQIGVSRRKGRG